MKLYLDVFVVFPSLLLTTYFAYNHEDATYATTMNLKWSVHHISDCAFPLYGQYILTERVALDLNVEGCESM